MQKILIVDDDAFLLDMYAVKFSEAGYSINTAKSVEEALGKLREGMGAYDVVLLDMVMPNQTGLDLLKAIKDDPKTYGTPVRIVLSNQGEKADIEAATALGAAGYIIKANASPSEVVKQVWEYYQAASPK
jgi:two-component system, chemotaxis family, chemotaxis protein CheY